MTYAPKSNKKPYLALALTVIIIVASISAAWIILSTPKAITVGVKAGDTFTYSIKGNVILFAENATASPGLEMYNATDYYKVTITDVTGTNVTFDTVWRFLNGTEIKDTENFDVSLGKEGISFWAIYPSNLNKGELLRPHGYDQTHVNNTYTKTYASGDRVTNYWFINNQFQDVRDATGATLMYDYRNIDFDQATGMLVALENFQAFNNPERNEEIVWTLVSTNVWDI